jgi:hypothetical protein
MRASGFRAAYGFFGKPASRRDPLPEPVRCHRKTAHQYMSIAGNEALANVTSMLHLPCDATLLYLLSRIDKEGPRRRVL